MKTSRRINRQRELLKRGSGVVSSTLSLLTKPVGAIINTAIDALPVELHLPGGYQYCGPGTKLKERIARGDPGINKLDQACKQHDIAYSKFSDSANRLVADRVLANKAWERVKSSDASVGEKAASLVVAAAMKGKTAVGGGHRRKVGGGKKRRVGRKSNQKRGGNIRKRRKHFRNKKKNNPTIWSMLKKGQGLYLKPYRVY